MSCDSIVHIGVFVEIQPSIGVKLSLKKIGLAISGYSMSKKSNHSDRVSFLPMPTSFMLNWIFQYWVILSVGIKWDRFAVIISFSVEPFIPLQFAFSHSVVYFPDWFSYSNLYFEEVFHKPICSFFTSIVHIGGISSDVKLFL